MNQLALCVQTIKRNKQLFYPSLQEILGEPTGGVVAKEVFPTVPHGPQDKTAVVAIRSRKNELIQSTSQVPVARLRMIDFAEVFVDIELMTVILFPGEYLQRYMTAFPG